MVNVPGFEYPASGGTELMLTIAQRPWNHVVQVIGNRRESAAGIAATRTIRRDNLLEVTIRFEESELAAVLDMIEWMQDHPNTASTFWPDQEVDEVSFDVVLISPAQGDSISPTRGETGSDMELTLTLRQAINGVWTGLEFFDEAS